MESLLMPIVDFDTLGRHIKEEDFSCLSMDSPTEDISHSSPLGLEADLPAIDAESTNSPIGAPSTPTGASSILDDEAPSHTSTPTGKRKRGGGTKRKQVKRACSNCRKAHAGCDENRPCRRCVGGGKENTCKDVPRKKRSRSRTDTKDKTSSFGKKDKKVAGILDGIEPDELNHNIASAIEQNSRKRKRSNSGHHHHHHDSENSCSSDCHSSQGESDHNCDSEAHQHTENKTQTKKRRNLSQSSSLKRDKSFPANPLSSSTSSIFSHSKIKSENSDYSDSTDLIKSEVDFNEGDNTEEESIFDSDLQSSSKQLVFSTFTNYGNILNSNSNSSLSNPNSLQSNPLQANNNSNTTNWNINYGWNDGTTMENKLQDLLGEVKYSLNYQQHSLSIHPTENGYGIEGIHSEEIHPVVGSIGIVGTNGMGGIQEEEIGKSLDLNSFFEGAGTEYLGEGDENGFIYGWEEILNNNS